MGILVIDIGTSSMRGILYDKDGKKRLKKQIKYQPVHKGSGYVEQRAGEFEETLLAILQDISTGCKMQNMELDAISITSQRSSVVPVDKEGNPLMDFIMWQDTRNRELCQRLEQYNALVYERSGSKVNCVFSGGKMSWIRENRPEIYQKVHKFTNIPEYLIHKMTGEYVTDFTYGSRSNLMNLRTCQWDEELLRIFGIGKEKLCELKVPGSISGYITKEYAEIAGIAEGIPVISAGGDQQCASVGYGAFQEGVVSIVTGTGAYLTAIRDGVPEQLTDDLICNYSSVEGKYILEGNVLTCCSAFDWYCRTFFDWKTPDYVWLEQELKKKYEEKNADGGCISLPYFQGRSTPHWNASARATFHNISLATDRIDVLKSMLEGIFMEVNHNIHCLQKYVPIRSAGVSGGLTNNRVLNQIQADVYGMPLTHLQDAETTANGAYMIAAKSLGYSSSLQEAFENVCRWTDLEYFEPDAVHHNRYQETENKMNDLYEKIYA